MAFRVTDGHGYPQQRKRSGCVAPNKERDSRTTTYVFFLGSLLGVAVRPPLFFVGAGGTVNLSPLLRVATTTSTPKANISL